MANGYKKIGGGGRPGRFAVTQISLWQGPDHLLQIEKDGYSEHYRRFYFADIETFTIRRDNRQRNYTIFLIIVLAFLVWILAITSGFGRAFTGFWVAFFLIPLIVNLVKGPTCVTHLATAVQRQELQSLRRVKTAERALNQALAGSTALHGTFSAEEVRVRFGLLNAPPILAPPPIPPAGASDLPPV